MGVRPFDEIFRDFVINGLPASGPHHPEKKDIRDSLNALVAGSFPDNRVIKLNNANEGTENNIVVSASVAIPTAVYQVLYILNVTQENTGPVTISGAINRKLVTNTSEPVPAGYLKPGMAVLCVDTGSELRMLSYGDVEKAVEDLVSQAEAAEAAAELAKEQAQNAASDAVSQGNVPIYSTRNAVETLEIPAGITAFRTNGFASVGDGGAALYKRVASEPTHAGKVMSADGAWWELAEETLTVQMFGATLSGNQSGYFAELEGFAIGKRIDLGGQTYQVTTVPDKNEYVNGYFSFGGMVRSTLLSREQVRNVPRWQGFGGQLTELKSALLNPLNQLVGIVLVGDSITWGATLPDNGATNPRDGTLTDPRDNFISASWANELKRYLGSVYAPGASPVLSNWATAASGQAIATYTVPQILFPGRSLFTVTINGGSTTLTEVSDGAAISGFQNRADIGHSGSYVDYDFRFTGSAFDFHYASVSVETNADYDLYVNGTLIGTYSTSVGVDGAVQGSNNKRTHTFGFIRDKLIRIRAKHGGGAVTRFRPTAIVVNKKIRITNQGINGIAARNYYNNALSGSYGGVAISPDDSFVFCQLGTNDRIKHSSTPWGPNAFRGNLETLVGQMEALAPHVILMCANPTSKFDPDVYSMEMSTIRGVIRDVAVKGEHDFIDNFAAFDGYDLSVMLADGLHPNRLGHALIARNIIGSVEAA